MGVMPNRLSQVIVSKTGRHPHCSDTILALAAPVAAEYPLISYGAAFYCRS
jgi:hypothetical protein